MITPEQLATWLEDPVTRALHRTLRAEVDSLKEAWAAGAFQHESPYTTHIEQAHQQGRIALSRELLGLDAEQLNQKE